MKIGIVLVYSLLCCLVTLSGYFANGSLAGLDPNFTEKTPDAQASAKQTLPGKMVLDDPGKYTQYAGDKGKTDFDHDQHVKAEMKANPDKSCAICHHTNSDKLNNTLAEPVAKCTACHKDVDGASPVEGTRPGVTFKGKNAVNVQEAFHGKDSIIGCIGCHKERNLEKIDGCTECHVR